MILCEALEEIMNSNNSQLLLEKGILVTIKCRLSTQKMHMD